MHPELKAYLDEFEAKAQARYDRQSTLQDALLAKLLAGVSTPQPAHSPVVASDGGLAIDAADAAVLPEVSSSTTKAQDVLEVIHDASPDYITMAPVTCSTDCLAQQPMAAPVLIVSSSSTPTEYGLDTTPATRATATSVASELPVRSSSNTGISDLAPPSTRENAQEMLEPISQRFVKSQDAVASRPPRRPPELKTAGDQNCVREPLPRPWPSFKEIIGCEFASNADGDGTRPLPWLSFGEVNGVVSTETASDMDGGEHGASVDNNSVHAIPCSLVPVLSITTGNHDDSTPSPTASNRCSTYYATAVSFPASPPEASIIPQGQCKYDMVHLMNIFSIGLKSLNDMEIFWNSSLDQNNAYLNCYTLTYVLATTRSSSGYKLLAMAADLYVEETIVNRIFSGMLSADKHQLSACLNGEHPSQIQAVPLQLSIAYSILKIPLTGSAIICVVAVSLEDGNAAAYLNLHVVCFELVGKNEQPNYITADSCEAGIYLVFLSSPVGLVYCSESRLYQFMQYLVQQIVRVDFSGQKETIVTIGGNIYQEDAYLLSNFEQHRADDSEWYFPSVCGPANSSSNSVLCDEWVLPLWDSGQHVSYETCPSEKKRCRLYLLCIHLLNFMLKINQKTIQLKLQYGDNQLCLRVMSMSVHWQFLNQEKFKGSIHFDRKCRTEELPGGSKTRIQLVVLISFEYFFFKCIQDWILLVRALFTDAYAHEVWLVGYMICRCTLSKIVRRRGYIVQPSVAAMKLQATELFCFSLSAAKPPDNHARCILILVEIQLRVLVSLYFMDRMISTEALKKCGCQHLISTEACNLFLDKGRLRRHLIYGQIISKLWQSSSMQCVQPTNSVPAYLKSQEVCAAVVHMFEQRTSQDWRLLLYFNQRPPGVYFGMANSSTISLSFSALFIDDSVQHRVISIYASPLFRVGIWATPLLGSKSASGYRQLWDPGGNASSLWISQLLEEIDGCRETLVLGQNLLDALEFSSRREQASFQGGRLVILVAAFVEQGFVDHEYYPSFEQDGADNNFFIGAYASHNYGFYHVDVYLVYGYHGDSDQVQEHRVQWDPGGSRWRRLGVKPNFKEGGMLGTYRTGTRTWACLGPAYGPGPCVKHPALRLHISKGSNERGIRMDHGTGGWLSPSWLPFFHLWLLS